jgi:hypothetical protein
MKLMKYVFSLAADPPKPENIGAMIKGFQELIEQAKPDAMYFSTIRRYILLVVDVEDPHVELRKLFEGLSQWGDVTIDPVSTFEEFAPFIESAPT